MILSFRRISAAAVALAGTLSLSSALTLAQTGDAPIRIGVGPVDTATPIFYAVKGGIYKKYGLNIELVKVPNGAATAAAMAGGSLDMGQASPVAVMTAIIKGGLPLIVIGNLSSYVSEHPDYALLVAANSSIKTAKDLEGQTLAAVSLKDQNSLATFAWLDAQGVDRSKLKYVEIPASATLAAMEQNRVVAATFYEPFFTAFMATGKVRVLGYPMDAIGKRFADSILFGSAKWVGEHPDAVNKFLRATQEAAVYVGAHESETPQIAAEFTGVDPATVTNVRHGTRGVLLSPTDLQPMIDVLAKYEIIPKRVPAGDIICSCALKR